MQLMYLATFGTSLESVQVKEPGRFVPPSGMTETIARLNFWKHDMNPDSIFSAVVFAALLLSMGGAAIATLFLLSGGREIFGQVKRLARDNCTE